MKKRQGVTLIEVIIVAIIVTIVVGLAIPGYQKTRDNALHSEARTNLNIIYAAQKNYNSIQGVYATDFTDLNLNLPTENFQYILYQMKLPGEIVVAAAVMKPLTKQYCLWITNTGEIPPPSKTAPSGTTISTRG